MNMGKWSIFLISTAFLFGFIGTAGATPMEIPNSLDIDFRDDMWEPASWNSVRVENLVGDVNVRAAAGSGNLIKKGPLWFAWVNDKLRWSEGNGLGMYGYSSDKYSNDKVNGSERFRMYFSEKVIADKLWLTGYNSVSQSDLLLETKFEIEFGQDGGDIPGFNWTEKITVVDDSAYIDLTGLIFDGIDIGLNGHGIEFWVAGFDGFSAVPTPEPATMLLLGTGLLGLAGFGRKKMLKKDKS